MFLPSLALSLSLFDFILYSAEVNQLHGFYQHFVCSNMELSHVPSFFFYYYYFWRVEVKLTCCSLEVFHEAGQFCIFILSGSLTCFFLFLSSTALKLTSFLNFISILFTVRWSYPTCQAFFFFNYFWRVEVTLTCCSLEVFHQIGLVGVFILCGSLACLF